MPKHPANTHQRRPLKLVVVFKSASPTEQKKQKQKEYSSRLAKERSAVRSRLTADLRTSSATDWAYTN